MLPLLRRVGAKVKASALRPGIFQAEVAGEAVGLLLEEEAAEAGPNIVRVLVRPYKQLTVILLHIIPIWT